MHDAVLAVPFRVVADICQTVQVSSHLLELSGQRPSVTTYAAYGCIMLQLVHERNSHNASQKRWYRFGLLGGHFPHSGAQA